MLYAVVAIVSFNYRWTTTKALLFVAAQNVAFSTQLETVAIILMMPNSKNAAVHAGTMIWKLRLAFRYTRIPKTFGGCT
jgi:hypothetical protein